MSWNIHQLCIPPQSSQFYPAYNLSDCYPMDGGGTKALRPPHSEDQDEGSFAKEKNRKQEMKGENFTGSQQDFESGQLQYVVGLPSSHSSEVSSAVDDLDESVDPSDGR